MPCENPQTLNGSKTLNSKVFIGLEIQNSIESHLIQLEETSFISKYNIDKLAYAPFQYIKSNSAVLGGNDEVLDFIPSSDKEQYIIDALIRLEPLIEKVLFKQNPLNGKREVLVKLKNCKSFHPLKSMGEGINRMYVILQTIVSSEGKCVLIDAFEKALHHSVQVDF